MSTTQDILSGVGSALDFMSRTQRGWVKDLATIFGGAAKVASQLMGMGKEPEEIRALLEDLVNNPPKSIDTSKISSEVDTIIERRKKEDALKKPV